jgi:formate hydrogenlyase subunit 6/NADH:ubiquinone oxidoreductase subunit I
MTNAGWATYLPCCVTVCPHDALCSRQITEMHIDKSKGFEIFDTVGAAAGYIRDYKCGQKEPAII